MIRAVIFDMDGTMVESESLWKVVNTKLGDQYGVTFDDIVRVQMMGRKDSECLGVFKDYFHLDAPVEELIQARRAILLSDISAITVKEGLFELLDLLDRLGIKKAVATSSFTEFTQLVLEKFHIRERFEIVVTGDEVKNGKPHPEMFLEAARRIDVPASACLVLEDAQNGVEAAVNAEMKVIAIPHKHTNLHDYSKATRVLDSMLQVDEALLKSI